MTILLTILPWIQIILSVLLVTLILLQQSEAGLGSAFGGSGGEGGGAGHTRRGSEKVIFQATIVVAVLFVLSVALSLVV